MSDNNNSKAHKKKIKIKKKQLKKHDKQLRENYRKITNREKKRMCRPGKEAGGIKVNKEKKNMNIWW